MPSQAGRLRAGAGLALAAAVAWMLAAEGSGQPPTRASASRAAPAAPATQLTDQARLQAAAMLARLDETFHAVVRPPFVIVGNLPEDRLAVLAEGSVMAPAQAMWKSYFRQRPTDVITALLFNDEQTYRHWAKELYGDTGVAHFGYFKRSQRTLVMNISTGTGTLVHELTHALLAYDFPDSPAWFNEGLASLHEQCQVQRDRIVGLPNWRLPALQQAIADKSLRSLRDLVTADDFYGRLQGSNYAQARYLVMYMQQRDLLNAFYEHFRQRHEGADAAAKAIEKVFAQGIDAVEADWRKWVMTLRFP